MAKEDDDEEVNQDSQDNDNSNEPTATATATTTTTASAEEPKEHLTEAERNLARTQPLAPIYRFVFTGGPCGGKTTALARAFSYLRERGFEVITCPEAFTLLSSNGMSLDFFSTEGMGPIIQGVVLDTQLHLENGVTRVLKARGKPGIVLCDRGTMDSAVYVTPAEFQGLLDARKTNTVQLRDNRYEAVFHLVTAADGAEHYYTLENNKVRTETKEQAREVDRRTQKAWVGHPHLYVLDNTTDFEGKMNRLINVMSKIVGLPSNLKRRSAKFLLREIPDPVQQFPPEIDFQVFEVEKIYLQRPVDEQQQQQDLAAKKPENYSFIRRRTNIDTTATDEGDDDEASEGEDALSSSQRKRLHASKLLGSVYQITTVTDVEDHELIEEKRIISEREYASASLARDPHRKVILQHRISFLYNKQSFVIHMYKRPAAGLCILHAQVEASTENNDETKHLQVDLPPFLQVERQLVGSPQDEKYGAYYLSLIDSEPPTIPALLHVKNKNNKKSSLS